MPSGLKNVDSQQSAMLLPSKAAEKTTAF
jgi:hypothetical protein